MGSLYNNLNNLVFYTNLLTVIVILINTVGMAQELPPIQNYSTDVYRGGNQNWNITQTTDKSIYVANNRGLLEFKGTDWTLYDSPNKSILRSVLAIGDSVYSGCYMDFGYWKQDRSKMMRYHSLTDSLDLALLEDEQFWNILSFKNWVLFQSLNRIYFYDTNLDSIHFIESENTINKLFKAKGNLFYQVIGKGLFTIIDGKSKLMSNAAVFRNDIVTSLSNKSNKLYAVMREQGIYTLHNGKVEKWNIEANSKLAEVSIYNSQFLQDDGFAIGTIANGVYILSSEGRIEHHIDQDKGLGDNTALTLFEDQDQNIWIGLDNGIDCINLNSAYSMFIDRTGRLGTIYTSKFFNGNLYLGTNQGLFYKKQDDDDFKFIEGTEGQVWYLNDVQNTLFCGHNSGTFVVDQGEATRISDVMGTWAVKAIPGKTSLLLQGNYDGLYVLSNEGGSWKLRNKLAGFDISSKHFEILEAHTIFVNHEYKGVFKLTVDATYTEITAVQQETSVSTGAASGLAAYDDIILYTNEEGIFYYNEAESKFLIQNELNSIITEDTYVSGVMVSEAIDRLWIFTENYINLITKDVINGKYRVKKIPLNEALRHQMKGYENISQIVEDSYLLGTSNGYLLFDLSEPLERKAAISINKIFTGNATELDKPSDFDALQLKPNKNFLRFEYSVPIYQKFLDSEYQYRLLKDGSGDWSNWMKDAFTTFQNLPYGNYRFQVKAKINNKEIPNIAEYAFNIEKPWYASNIAKVVYFIGGVLLIIAINSLYTLYFRKQRERLLEVSTRELKVKELESQKEIIQLKNESLNQDISARNRELAISTMSTIKKNEALNNIKQELLKISENQGVSKVVKMIDETMNDIKDWKYFEEAFNHADKDFFKKVKETHPELSASDLRLCVYLRLNLSSKEIAPLLNISPRSVEIKRYRLRKKIGLPKDVKLNDYFIDL